MNYQRDPIGPTITICGEQVHSVQEADFLGLTFDVRMTWEPQTRKMLSRAYKRLNLLRSIAALTTKPNPDTLLMLYKSTIRSIFEYSDIGITTAAECHLRKLQLVQNQALRLTLATPAYVSIHDLHDCSGLKPVSQHLKDFAQKRLTRLKQTSPILAHTIQEHTTVQHIKENTSLLDILSI